MFENGNVHVMKVEDLFRITFCTTLLRFSHVVTVTVFS
jgi:hypothetical protein